MSRDGKVVSKKALYAKRKTISIAFFHYCESHSVVDYENSPPPLNREWQRKTTLYLAVIASRMSCQNCLSSKTCGSSSRYMY